MTREQVLQAGKEVADLIVLAVDETPNSQQIQDFAVEGFQAFNALAKVGIPVENREAVIRTLAEGILTQINKSYKPLPE